MELVERSAAHGPLTGLRGMVKAELDHQDLRLRSDHDLVVALGAAD